MKFAEAFPTLLGLYRWVARKKDDPAMLDLSVTALSMGVLLMAWSIFLWMPLVIRLFDIPLPIEPTVPFVGLRETLEAPGCVRSSIPDLAVALLLAAIAIVLVEAVKMFRGLSPRPDSRLLNVLLLALQVILPLDLMRSLAPDWFTALLASVQIIAWPKPSDTFPMDRYPILSGALVLLSGIAIISQVWRSRPAPPSVTGQGALQ